MLSNFIHFYPRPPGGGRQHLSAIFEPLPEISIHALRVEGDELAEAVNIELAISIHALRVEGDGAVLYFVRPASQYFYPRPPGGGRHEYLPIFVKGLEFLSTPSGWRATGVG